MNEGKGKMVELLIVDTDQYGKKVARVLYERKDLSEELIANGYAWHYKKYSSDKQLAELEEEARAKRIGLRKDPSPVAPWNFRKRN